jgi:hypothetical protein
MKKATSSFLSCIAYKAEGPIPDQSCLVCERQIVGADYCSESCLLSDWSITGKPHDQHSGLPRTSHIRDENDDNPRTESEGEPDKDFDVGREWGFDFNEFCGASDTGDRPWNS